MQAIRLTHPSLVSIANGTLQKNFTTSYPPIIARTNFCGSNIPAYYFTYMKRTEREMLFHVMILVTV